MTKTTEMLDEMLIIREEALRRSGRTTRIVKEAMDSGAIMVCHNYQFAHQISKEYGIKTISIDSYLSPDYGRGSKTKKHVFDHHIEFVLIQQKLKEVERIMNGSLDTDYARF